MKRLSLTALLGIVLSFGVACGPHNAPILLGQTGLATVQSIGALQDATKALTTAAVLPPAVALQVQEKLLALNDKLKPLPDMLRTINDLQKAGSSSASQVDQALALLQVVGQDISVVIAGVPVSDLTAQLITLIRTAQSTIQTTLIEVAKLKGAQ